MKKCEKCGCDALVRFMSMNLLQCGDCGHQMVWKLKPGQKPLVGNNRQVSDGN